MELFSIRIQRTFQLVSTLIQKDSDPQLVKFVNSIDSVPEVETA